MALEKLQLPQQAIGRAPIVGIQSRDKFASRRSAAAHQSRGNSDCRLGQNPNARIVPGGQC
jgi:hypothetical protein